MTAGNELESMPEHFSSLRSVELFSVDMSLRDSGMRVLNGWCFM
jgi:hypothetical protein